MVFDAGAALAVAFFASSDAGAFAAVHTTPITTVASSDDGRMKLSDLKAESRTQARCRWRSLAASFLGPASRLEASAA